MDRLHLHRYDLFKGLTQKQFTQLNTIAEEVHLAENFVIMNENEHCDFFYLIAHGSVEISKKDPHLGQSQFITILKAGSIFGEVSLFDEGAKSASVYTITPTTLIKISKTKLKALSHKEDTHISKRLKKLISGRKLHKSIYETITENLGKTLSKRLRNSNDILVETMRKELELSKERVAMGYVIINTIASLCLYVWITQFVASLRVQVNSTSFLSIPLLAILGVAIFVMMKNSGYPLSLYGLTTKNWKRSVVESFYLTAVLALLTVACKGLLINFLPAYMGKSLFNINSGFQTEDVSIAMRGTIILLYFIFVPLQELIIRGALQSSFNEFLIGRYRVFWSILLSNFFFSIIHIHLSLAASLIVFIPGIAWGWLYSRHHTLIGVTLSHLFLGFWALYIVGIF